MSFGYDVTNWYWKVSDTNPTTHRFSSASGSYVVLADATYAAWVAAGNTATTIDTEANLYIVINRAALDNLPNLWQVQSLLAGGDIALANPLPTLTIVAAAPGPHVVALPQANMPNGMPIGEPFYIRNSPFSASTFDLYNFTGASLLYSALAIGAELRIIKKSNASLNGTYDILSTPELPVSVPNGGTGTNTLTDHGVLLGSGTGAITPTAVMTNGQLLVGQTGADPLPKTISGGATLSAGGVLSLAYAVRVQTFTASGTYTPDANLLYALFETRGGGGGGGGAAGTVGDVYAGGGGGSGGYSTKVASTGTVGPSQTVTIGAGGAGGAAGANNGTAGGDTSVGTICIGKGGAFGKYGSVAQVGLGGAGGIAGTGDQAEVGFCGGDGMYATGTVAVSLASGRGGGPGGAAGTTGAANTAGANAGAYGGGGSGAHCYNTAGTAAGGNGSAGFVKITEFCKA